MASSKNSQKLSVVGLGKLGACLAASLSYRGFEVLGHDINTGFVDAVNKGKAPVVEPRLQELITKSKGRLSATSNPDDVIEKTDVTFIIVPTPSTKKGDFSSAYVEEFLAKAMPTFKKKKKWHLFVITSTVSPTTTEQVLVPLIEKKSGKKLGRDFGVCYNPEFIALGDVVAGTLNPDLVLIGESDKKSGDILEKIHHTMCENSPYVARMSIVSAEIAKISINSYVTMKISFANTLGNICEKIPGANADDVTRALGADSRIGKSYIKAGAAYGGPCFPRDNRAFGVFAKEFGINAKLARATDDINNYQTEHLFKNIEAELSKKSHKSISILGLSYKPRTHVIEESVSIKVIEKLIAKYPKLKIYVYDPCAVPGVEKVFGKALIYAESAKACMEKSSLWVIVNPEGEYAKAGKKLLQKDISMIDCWRILGRN
jgi:UDPglucose 6-dehydrogenase